MCKTAERSRGDLQYRKYNMNKNNINFSTFMDRFKSKDVLFSLEGLLVSLAELGQVW